MLAFYLAVLESDEDRRKFTAIYEQRHAQLEKLAMATLKDQSDAEDAVQNAFVQVIHHFQKISTIPCENLFFWLISIVKNEANMILRKKRRIIDLEDWNDVGEQADSISSYMELVELFAELPKTYREVLEMKVFLGYTDQEIAAHLGISKTAVSTRASRGRALLRKILEKEGFQL